MPYPSPALYPEPLLYHESVGGDVITDPPRDPWIPTPTLVARILRARVVLLGGRHVEDFTAETDPTRAEIEALITMHAPLVLMRTGSLALTCTDAGMLQQAAATLIAERVAIEVELSYVPEEVQDNAAAANDLRRQQITDDIEALVTAVERCRTADGGSDGGSVSPNDPAWLYPVLIPLRF
jgi:hypothetical protein